MNFGRTLTKPLCASGHMILISRQSDIVGVWFFQWSTELYLCQLRVLGGGLSDLSVQGKCFLIPRLFSLSLISIIVSCPPRSYYLSCPLLYPLSLPHLASSLLCFYILLSFPSPSSLRLQSTNTRDLVKQLEEARSIE